MAHLLRWIPALSAPGARLVITPTVNARAQVGHQCFETTLASAFPSRLLGASFHR